MMEIKIIFEDDSLAVIDKPAGLIVNRADTTRGVSTIQEWAEEKFGIPNSDNSEFNNRGGIVHRLDKETSGILIIAKNEDSFVNLQSQFKQRSVKKVYVALCHGRIESDGEVDVPIGRLPWNRTKFGFLPEGREAKTLYKVLEHKKYKNGKKEEDLTLIELYPQTGRTHQIRVHMRHMGYPIFSDELYAGRKAARADRKLLPRHFLHASKITFSHPKTNETMTLESVLPADLANFLSSLDQ